MLGKQTLITEDYIESILNRIQDLVLSKGIMSIGLVSTQVDIPVEYLSKLNILADR